MTGKISPFWDLSINGTRMSDDMKRRSCITSISLLNNSDGSDTLTLQASDPDFLFIEDNIFIDDAAVSGAFGFNEDTYRVKFSGYVSAIDISFPEEGNPALTITCLDETHRMNRVKKSRSWENTTRPEVVRKIAAEYGYNFVCESGYSFISQDSVSQSNQTDIEFIEGLAGEEENDLFLCKLIGNTVYYVKMGILTSPVATLFYKKYPYTILSFTPQITKEDIKSSVTESDVTTDTKETSSATVDTASESQGTEYSGDSEDTTSDDTGSSSGSSSNIHYDRDSGKWVIA